MLNAHDFPATYIMHVMCNNYKIKSCFFATHLQFSTENTILEKGLTNPSSKPSLFLFFSYQIEQKPQEQPVSQASSSESDMIESSAYLS